jgi:Domain of unknown function (DUF4124)
MYRLIVTLAAALIFSTAAHATKMYRWVDEKGVTHFSTHQPPRPNADKTRLKGGSLNQPRPSIESQEITKIEREDLADSGWQDCNSNLCQTVRQIDPDCRTSFCSRAKTYSNDCTSAGCLTKKLAFEQEMQDRLAAQNELRQREAINADATPVAPGSQSQD